MRAVWTLAEKDLRGLLTSPLFYIISGLCTFMWSFNYIRTLLFFAERSRAFMQPGMDSGMNLQQNVFLPHISYINLLYVFFIPALTMRLLSEEKRQRTYDLLLTSPVTATEIALGKFVAGFGAVLVLTAISFLYPLGTRFFTDFPFGPLLSAYAGVLLVSAAYVAVGLFASSLTESVMLSVVMGLIFNIMLWFISQGSGGEGASWYSPVIEYMSIGQHFIAFIMGAIKLNALVFLLSVTGLFIFLTQRVVESSRWR
jgi:ABC-2 type transport system permease protein